MLLAYLSSIPCDTGGGGGLQIHRHFAERRDFAFEDCTVRRRPWIWDRWLGVHFARSAVFKRIRSSRLFPGFLLVECIGGIRREATEIERVISSRRPTAILTVGYGRECFVAEEVSRMTGIPLITIFHDWWPDLVEGATPFVRTILDRRFRRLAKHSVLILPVSDELRLELGDHPNALILPPIPTAVFPQNDFATQAPPFRPSRTTLVYAGTLAGSYGAMILKLAKHLLLTGGNGGWTLKAYGPIDLHLEQEWQKLAEAGIYGGILAQGKTLDCALQQADVLLVVMDFEPKNRRRVRTSFPCKILDYAAFAKPIVVWGPAESFAARFADRHGLGWVITEEDTASVDALFSSRWSAKAAEIYGQSMAHLYRGDFSPNHIHQMLISAIDSTIALRRA